MSEVDELKPCPFCGSKDIDERGWLSGDGGAGPQCMNCGATAEPQWWNTRAESPDSVVVTTNEFGQAVAVTRQDREGRILSTIWESPPPPVAAEGELIERLDHWIDRFESGDWPNDSTLKLLKACRSALQSRSTPPPVAGGELQRQQEKNNK